MRRTNLARRLILGLAMIAAAALWLNAQTASLDQILKEISAYDGGIDSGPLWKLRDYVKGAVGSTQSRSECEARLLEFLSTKATPVAKMAVCRQLRLIGGDRSVAVLAPMLLDPAASDMALYVLQKIPGAVVDQALLQALAKAEGPMKTAIIAALGDRKSAAAIPVLSSLLKPKGDFTVAAALALGEIGGDAAANTLTASMAGLDAAVQPVAASSLLKCAEGHVAAKNERAASVIYEKLLADTSLPMPVRQAAMLGRIAVSGDRAAAVVIEQIKGKDPAMQEVAILKLKETVKPEGIATVCSLVPDLSDSTQVKLLAVLAGYPKLRVLPAVLRAAGSSAESVRMAAYQALESVGDVAALKMLVEAASKTRGAEQSAARNAIALLKGRPVDDSLLAWLGQDPAEEIQGELLQAVSERRIFAAKGLVSQCLQSNASRVRVQALRTLRVIGTPSDMPAIAAFLIGSEEDVTQGEAINTIAALAQKINNPDGRSNMVKDMLRREKDPKARIKLLRVLGRIGDDSSLAALRAELSGTNEEVADAAARAIMGWPTPAARDDVLQLAQKSKNETHRLLALQALLRMIRADRYRKPEAAVADLRQAYALAVRPEEKRLILGALPNFACPEALELAAIFLGDSSVKAEAQAAIDKLKPKTGDRRQ
jgi:HEAT repeat protein